MLKDAIPIYLYESQRRDSHSKELFRSLSSLSGMPEESFSGEDWRVETEQRGKPYFPDHPETAFSISDCGTLAVVAFDRSRLGVDLQEHRRARRESPEKLLFRCRRIAARAFSEREQRFVEEGLSISSQEVIRRFFAIWSAKEAYVKYTGTGIDDGFSKFSVLKETNQSEETSHPARRGAMTENEAMAEASRIVPFVRRAEYAWYALSMWFYLAELIVDESGLIFSLCVCAEKKKRIELVDQRLVNTRI
jgi:4'-phosphopantetheinyl transferase